MQWAQKQKGFTIVELLIVVVVIAILAAITVVAYQGITEQAKVSQANTELRTLEKAILQARVKQNKELRYITGSNCTYCGDQARYELSIDNLAAAASMDLSTIKDGDPWGNIYRIDENEAEGTGCANLDSVQVINAASHPGLITLSIPFYGCLF